MVDLRADFTRLPLFLVIALVTTSCAREAPSARDSSLPAGTSAGERLPIIDMHMHARMQNTRAPGGGPAPRPCVPAPCVEHPPAGNPGGSILQGTLAAMDRYNIVLGYLSDPYEAVDEWVRAAPNRFFPGAAIPPGPMQRDLPDVDLIRDGILSGRFKGIGEIATQYLGIPPNDSRLKPYFAIAEELDVPVLIHSGGLGAPEPTFRSSLGAPLLLEEVLVAHPRLRIYVENAGYPYLDEIVALMTQYPQVYADISTITWIIPRSAFHRYLRSLVDAGLSKRLMWGSDQMEWPETIGLGIEAVETADFLTAEQKRDIFYNNATRFLRLEEGR